MSITDFLLESNWVHLGSFLEKFQSFFFFNSRYNQTWEGAHYAVAQGEDVDCSGEVEAVYTGTEGQ